MQQAGYADEKRFLNEVYHTYTTEISPYVRLQREWIVRTFEPFISGGHMLEFGCAGGYITEMLSQRVETLDVVDGSEKFLAEARRRSTLPNVNFIYSLFEEFETDKRYDYVIASFILEHVLDTAPVLAAARRVLKPGGLLFAVVPNERALSRQLALCMDIIPSLDTLTENDHKHGHRRTYDRHTFNKDLQNAGFECIAEGGLILKILADFQLNKLLNDGFLTKEHIAALYALGKNYPDLCGELYTIARVKT